MRLSKESLIKTALTAIGEVSTKYIKDYEEKLFPELADKQLKYNTAKKRYDFTVNKEFFYENKLIPAMRSLPDTKDIKFHFSPKSVDFIYKESYIFLTLEIHTGCKVWHKDYQNIHGDFIDILETKQSEIDAVVISLKRYKDTLKRVDRFRSKRANEYQGYIANVMLDMLYTVLESNGSFNCEYKRYGTIQQIEYRLDFVWNYDTLIALQQNFAMLYREHQIVQFKKILANGE